MMTSGKSEKDRTHTYRAEIPKLETQKVSKEKLTIGLLGYGAINSKVAEMIADGTVGPAELTSILVQRERSKEKIKRLLPKECHSAVIVTTSAEDFFSSNANWSLCVEAAGQPAVREHAKRCLAMGRNFMMTSIGSLTDDALYGDLRATAEANGSRLILCTGSLPAVDWLGAATLDGCTEIKVTQTKPPKAWLGTKAHEENPDLLNITEPFTIFEGSARNAASAFPKNANVAAMLALATVGLDKTQASLIADPNATGNLVDISFVGPAGKIDLQVKAAPSKSNPRTSAIVALSVAKAIKKLCSPVVIGL